MLMVRIRPAMACSSRSLWASCASWVTSIEVAPFSTMSWRHSKMKWSTVSVMKLWPAPPVPATPGFGRSLTNRLGNPGNRAAVGAVGVVVRRDVVEDERCPA